MSNMQLSPADGHRVRVIHERVIPEWVRVMDGGWTVEPRSSLGVESARFEPTARLIWVSMVSAMDHLQAHGGLMLKAGQMHPFADSTLLRAALLASSSAVYYMDDSPGVGRSTRLIRLALGAMSDLKDRRFNVEAMRALAPSLEPGANEAFDQHLARIDEQIKSHSAMALDLGAEPSQLGRGLVANEAIKVAGRVAARTLSRSDGLFTELGVRSAWQRGSADAHSRAWQVSSRLAAARAIDPMATLQPDVGEIMTMLNSAVLMTSEAIRLYDLRRVSA